MRAPATRLLGLGSLLFTAWGLARPGSLGRTMGIDRSEARQVGIREAVIGTLLLVHPAPTSLGARVIADLSDAARTWEHDRRIAAFAMASATTAVGLAVAARRRGGAV